MQEQSHETEHTLPADQSRDGHSIDWSKNLTRKPLRARRTNPNADSRFINGGRNTLDITANNIFNSMNKSYREKSFISSPRSGLGYGRRSSSGVQQGFGNSLTFAALAGSTPKSLISPREDMSFSSSFLYSPGSKLGSPNDSMCSTNHRHYPTHQPEYSGLGQLPVVKWNEASSSPVWKRRTSMQSPVMVKIAPPDRFRSESPLVQSMTEDKSEPSSSSEENKANPCAKESVIAAIRECRKRGVDDQDDASSRASTPFERHKRRRVDGFSRSSTPSMASSSDYDTAPPSGRVSTTSSLNSDLPGPKGILSRTPRNAIKSSFSSAKRVPKRKLPESVDEEDEEEISFSPSKKPTLGLEVTSEKPQVEDTDSVETSKNGDKENKPETPKKTPAKRAKKQEDTEGGKDSDSSEISETRTPRKRSLRHLLAKQKTPLRGAALYARAANMMSNSPGEYTAADLQEDRHMARQRVSYIREALQEPEPPPPATTTGPAATITTSTATANLSLLTNLTSKPTANQTAPNTTVVSTTSSGLLAALAKATSSPGPTSITTSAAATSKPTLNFAATATSSAAAPSQTLGLGLGTLATSASSILPSSSVNSSSLFSNLSATNKPATTTSAGPLAAATTTSSFNMGKQSQPPSQAPPSYSSALSMSPNPGPLQGSITTGLGQPKTISTPTSSIGLLTQQIKAQDSGSAPNLTTPFQTRKPQAPPATSSQVSTPFASIFGNATTSATTLSNTNASTTQVSNILSAPSSTAQTSNGANPTFKPLFPSAANTTSAQQTPSFNFSATTPSTASSNTFKPLFNTSTTSSSATLNSSNPLANAGGGFQMKPTSTANSSQPATLNTSNIFQFGGGNNKPSTASTTSTSKLASNAFAFGGGNVKASTASTTGTSKPTSNAFAFGAQNAAQTNPSPFGAPSSTAGQTQMSIFGQSSKTPQSQQNQTNIFGSSAGPAFGGGQQSTASPFGNIASSTTTTTTQNPFGAKAPQAQNMFGQQQQQQTASPFGGAPQAQTQTASPFGGAPQAQTQNPFGGGATTQTQNPFGASTQAAPAQGVFTFGANNNAKPASGSSSSSGFNFGAAAQAAVQQSAAQQSASPGFNFSAAASTQNTGFNFGQSQQPQQQPQPNSGFQFGQQTPRQAAPAFGGQATPQPFNFAAGGSGFGSAPPSGRSTPVGNFSVGASTGTSTAAQRRARLRQAKGRSGRR